MVIQRITFRDFGGVSCYDAPLTPGLNILETRDTPVLSTAIQFLLCSAVEIPPDWVRESTRLEAEIFLADRAYTLRAAVREGRLTLKATDGVGNNVTEDYQDALYHCMEQDAAECFDGLDKTVPDRLFRYHNHRDYGRGLSRRTDRITDTKTFRAYLVRYIRAFQPEPIHNRKCYHTAINPQGRFVVVHPDIPDPVFLSETEEKLFFYICFLNTTAFWEDIEKSRDLHHERKPLLVQHFLEYLDESVQIHSLIARTKQLQRQVILLTHSLSDEAKRQWLSEEH